MSEPTMNQYAPPLATVADVPSDARTAEMKLFSAKGRIGRLRYLAYGAGSSLVYYLVLGVMAIGLSGMLANVVLVAAMIAMIWFSVITGIKRCHDIDISGWWSVTLIVPVIVLAWIFMPGGKEANRFGPPPPPNTLGVKVLGCLMPVMFVLGILAAIALPAYQAYTIKARAGQVAPAQ